MTYRNYSTQASKFCKQFTTESVDTKLQHKVHMALGFADEFHEYNVALSSEDNVNIVEEMGDLLWYIANYVNATEYDFEYILQERLRNNNFDKHRVTEPESGIINYVKAVFAYGRPHDDEKELAAIMSTIDTILTLATVQTENVASFIEAAMDANIKKLSKRYSKQTFDASEALNRNKVNELSHISEHSGSSCI